MSRRQLWPNLGRPDRERGGHRASAREHKGEASEIMLNFSQRSWHFFGHYASQQRARTLQITPKRLLRDRPRNFFLPKQEKAAATNIQSFAWQRTHLQHPLWCLSLPDLSRRASEIVSGSSCSAPLVRAACSISPSLSRSSELRWPFLNHHCLGPAKLQMPHQHRRSSGK